MRKAIVVSVAAALLVSACSSSGSGGNSGAPASGATLSGSITVLAAASLTETFTTIKSQFEAAHPGTTITYSFGASSDLATEITEGNPADVFAAASSKTMDQVDQAGDAVKASNFATNTMEIATPPGNPKDIKTVTDLTTSGTKVALCDFAVPCGVVAKAVFDNAKIIVNPTAREQDVKSTLALVESGEVDAGIVYVTDVQAAGNKVDGVEIPDDINATTTYPISVLKDAPNSALAQAFVDYVLSADGQKVLQSAGFAPA